MLELHTRVLCLSGVTFTSWLGSAARASHCATDAGGVQGTGGDMSTDKPHAHPKNEDAVAAAPPELPAQDLKQYKEAVLSLLQHGETVPAALRWGFFPCAVLLQMGWLGSCLCLCIKSIG